MIDTKDKRPTHIVYAVEGDDERAFWTRIGVAWTNKKGNGLSVSLTCVPLQGRVVIMERREEDDVQGAQPESGTKGGNGGQK